MAESTLSLAYADLVATVGRFLGLGDPAGYGNPLTYGTKAYIVEQQIKAGVRKFIFPPTVEPGRPPHSWSFLKPTTTLPLEAPFNDGTIDLVNGDATATITGGTLPTWIASGVLVYQGQSFPIASRTDGTHFELETAWATDSVSGGTFTINQQDYDLPDSFGYAIGELFFQPGVTYGGPIQIVGEGIILAKRQQMSPFSGRPTMACIRYKPLVASTTDGQRQEILFWPAPDQAYLLSYKFAALPDKLSATAVYTYGGMAHAETLKEACLAAAEELENDAMGLHGQAFMRQLIASIGVDMRSVPHLLGYNADRSDAGRRLDHRARGIGLSTYTDANGTRYPQ